MPTTIEIITLAFKLGGALAAAIERAIVAGDVATLTVLRGIIKDPEHMLALDEALILAQRVKNTVGLRDA